VEAATELVGEPPLLGQPGKVRPGESVGARHVHGEQFAAGPAGRDPGPAAQQRLPLGTPGQCDHDPLPGGPGALDAVVGPVAPHPLVDPVGQPEQRELAQGGEVADPEVVGEGGVDLLGAVHVAVGHPSPQRLGRHVDQLDLLGPADDLVGHRLALDDPRDRLDGIVERLQVLDVDGRDDVDPCVEQLVDVLPRFSWRLPGALVWASSSTSATAGRRVSTASRSISSTVAPRWVTTRRGRTSRPSSSWAVCGRPCVSTRPTTTSVPRSRRRWASSSIATVLPTPGAAPR